MGEKGDRFRWMVPSWSGGVAVDFALLDTLGATGVFVGMPIAEECSNRRMVACAGGATDARSNDTSGPHLGVLSSGGEVPFRLVQKPRVECTEPLSKTIGVCTTGVEHGVPG